MWGVYFATIASNLYQNCQAKNSLLNTEEKQEYFPYKSGRYFTNTTQYYAVLTFWNSKKLESHVEYNVYYQHTRTYPSLLTTMIRENMSRDKEYMYGLNAPWWGSGMILWSIYVYRRYERSVQQVHIFHTQQRFLDVLYTKRCQQKR